MVESKKCKSYEYPSLNCLESEPIKFAKKCINTYNFSISYDFDNKEIYKSLDIQPRVFDHYFGINCKLIISVKSKLNLNSFVLMVDNNF